MSRQTGIKASAGVKSADRVISIMEFFRERRRPATAREIASALSIPRSSVNVLLRSQIQVGYLNYDEQTLTYFPTLKLFQLGSWLIEGYLTDPVIDEVMRGLVKATGETVCLWVIIGESVRILRAIPSPQPISLTLREGDSVPLVTSTVGRTFLAAMSDGEVAGHLDRFNQARDRSDHIDLDDLMNEIRATRGRGTGIGYGRWLPDAGAVVGLLDAATYKEPVALAVGGPMFRVKRNEVQIEKCLRGALDAIQGLH